MICTIMQHSGDTSNLRVVNVKLIRTVEDCRASAMIQHANFRGRSMNDGAQMEPRNDTFQSFDSLAARISVGRERMG